jgi:hypothetical protein
MKTIKLSADVREINRFDFLVEVDDNLTPVQEVIFATDKLKKFLHSNAPYPSQHNYQDGVLCIDRESSMVTEETVHIYES